MWQVPFPAVLDRDPAPVLVRVVQPRCRDVQCPPAGAAGRGYILREGVDRIMDRRGLLKYSGYVTGAVSYVMLAVLVAVVVLPLVLNA